MYCNQIYMNAIFDFDIQYLTYNGFLGQVFMLFISFHLSLTSNIKSLILIIVALYQFCDSTKPLLNL